MLDSTKKVSRDFMGGGKLETVLGVKKKQYISQFHSQAPAGRDANVETAFLWFNPT
jgi:hypothetical protein